MRLTLDALRVLGNVALACLVAIAVVLICSCGTVPLPCDHPGSDRSCRAVRLIPGPEFSARDAYQLARGALAWRKLCFDVRAAGDEGCSGDYEIEVKRDYMLPFSGFAGYADLRYSRIRVAGGYYGDRLAVLATHEVGHFLLGDGHLADGLGVMSPSVASNELTEADRDWACDRTGHCEWCDE